jgi:tetratricopeptide (TPR) repeat protein
MERIGDRAADHAGRCANRVLASRRALLRLALALALVPALAGAQPRDLPAPLAERFSAGVKALAAGQLEPAEAAFRAVLRDGGDRAFVRHNLGIVLQRRGRHAEALAEFRAASRLDPAFGPSPLLAATSLLAVGRPKAAMIELDRAAKLLPGEPLVHLQRADACERLADVLCLVDEYRILAERSPAEPEYAYRLGKAYLRLSQWAHLRMQKTDPQSARLSQALGREYLEQGRADLAERAFLEAVGRDATNSEAHLALAGIYLSDGRLDAAAKAIERLLVVEPQSAAARAMRARIEAARARPRDVR